MNHKILLIAAISLTLPINVLASQTMPQGLYLRGFGGVAYVPEITETVAQPDEENMDLSRSQKTGYNGGGAIGYYLGHFRVEASGEHLHNDINDWENNGIMIGNHGEESANVAMLNGFYDLNTGSQFYPYFGIGIGYAHLNLNLASAALQKNDDTDNVFAYQGIIGFAYQVYKQLGITLDYRMLHTTNATFTMVDEDGNSARFEHDYASQLINLSILYRFDL